ncbi:Hypothetical predicted protein [Pelobates cultripes]|uniref:Uncharacterized protein n=1 Tax=Pelobates cultripes TaxID=61616 RepID=A0AAD1W510_PELCU|nr:Hypothetical predicted protein [Pelobates cultripes]
MLRNAVDSYCLILLHHGRTFGPLPTRHPRTKLFGDATPLWPFLWSHFPADLHIGHYLSRKQNTGCGH